MTDKDEKEEQPQKDKDERSGQGEDKEEKGEKDDKSREDRREKREDQEKDEEKERIHEGSADVQPEPALTAELDQLTEEEKRKAPAGVTPGAGPDEEPGPDAERRSHEKPEGDREEGKQRKERERETED